MKKSLYEKTGDSVQTYKPEPLDESGIKKRSSERNINDPQARIRAMETEGYEKGYKAGLNAAKDETDQAVQKKISAFDSIINEISQYKSKKVKELSEQIISLALDIAKKIVQKEIESDKDIVLFVALNAMKKISEREENITLRISPIDYEVIISASSTLKDASGVKDIVIEPDDSISPGGCYIVTERGEIDARIEEQVKEVEGVIRTATDREV
ncbi:MAG: FliH/SctL family protein [Dissulfurispiraceae bacterium]|nr:FliH/SctL family protein [Dissulfurispiraceae bacterium]